jgi:hypothetical protein
MKPPLSVPTPPLHEPSPEELVALELTPPDAGDLVQHPDGWYWLAAGGRQQFGPYASTEEARAASNAAIDEDIEPGETLLEAEQELGIADWLDPDTGEPAEETHTRIEDH